MILAARRPLVMIGAAGNRPRLVEPLSAFVRKMGVPFFNTQMGKGAVTGGSNLYLGTAALSEGDYVHEAVAAADLIIASMERAILSKKVTYDFARLMDGATQVSCSGFGQVMIDHM